MANAGKINIGIGFSVDKSGLNEMQSLFQQIANLGSQPGMKMTEGLKQASETAQMLNGILEKTYNSDLGSLNVVKFNQELIKSGNTIKDIQTKLAGAGNMGASAYNQFSRAILGTNVQLRESSKLLDDMAKSMANTVRWGITSSIFNNITSSIQKAVDYAKKLDTSLNDIRIVTDKSAESMEKFAQSANKGAEALGASTLDYTNASLIYYQQGLKDEEVKARTETTLKAANVTGQTGEAVSEQLTAVWNGYKVSAEETELYVDKLAAVAASTASDLEELSTGMSKVASAANSMGVDVDQLNAQLATIISVTRQAPENVGTALKTIYARLGDLKTDGSDEFGVTLGEVSSQLKSMGIEILDQEGNLRDMGEVIEEVAGKWEHWTEAQRQAAAVAMAGKRQYNNLIALFDNWDMYTASLETSANAMGTLQHQQDIYMESTAAKIQKLRTAWQGLYDDAIVTDEINELYDSLTDVVKLLDHFVSSFGGGIKSLLGFGAMLASMFNKQIADGINNIINRANILKQNLQLEQLQQQMISLGAKGVDGNVLPGEQANADAAKAQYEYAEKIYAVRQGLNQEQQITLTNNAKEIGNLQEKISLQEAFLKRAKESNTTTLTAKDFDFIETYKFDLFEIEEHWNNQIELVKSIINESEDLLNKVTQIEDVEAQQENILSSLEGVERFLNKEEQELVEQTKKQLENRQYDQNLLENIQVILEVINNKQKEIVQGVVKEAKQAKEVQKTYQEIANTGSRLNNVKQESDAMIDLAKNSKVVLQTVTSVTSALGSMAMAWSSMNSLMDTWQDDSTTTADKMLQTVLTASMVIPSAIASYQKLTDIFGKYTFSIKALNASLNQKALLEKRDAALMSVTTSTTEAKLVATQVAAMKTDVLNWAEKQENLTEEESVLIQKLSNASTEESIILLNSEAGKKLTKIALTKEETIALEEAAAAQEALNIAQGSNPIGLIILALSAVIMIIAHYTNKVEEARRKERELNEERLRTVKTTQEEINANKELYKSYMESYDAYKNNKISKEELKDTTQELCEKYNVEINKIDELKGNYDNLTKAIQAKRKAEAESKKRSASVGASTAGFLAVDAAKENSHFTRNGYEESIVFSTDWAGESMGNLSEFEKIVSSKMSQNGIKASEYADRNSYGTQTSFIIDKNNIEDLVKVYDALSAAITEMQEKYTQEELTASGYYKDITTWVSNMTESIEEYKKQKQILQESAGEIAALSVDWESIKSYDEAKEKIDLITHALEDQNIAHEEAVKAARLYASETGEIGKKYAKQIELVEQLAKEFPALTEQELINLTDKFSEKELTLMLSIGLTSPTEEQIHAVTSSIQGQLDEETITAKIEVGKTARTELTKGELSEETRATLTEQYELDDTWWENFDASSTIDQLNLINDLIQEQSNLLIENNEIRKKADHGDENNLGGTQKAIQDEIDKTSEKIKDYTENILPKLYEKRGRAAEGKDWTGVSSINKEIEEASEDVDKLNEKLKSLEENKIKFDFDININDELFDLFDERVDEITTTADAAKSAAELIGEGFKVAAKDAEALFKVYPALYDQAEILANGDIQLNQQVVDAIMSGNIDVIKSNAEVADKQLQQQIEIVQAQIDYNETRMEILDKFLQGKISQIEAEKQMEGAAADYEQRLIDIVGESQVNAAKQGLQGNTEATQGVLNNFAKIGQAATSLAETIQAALKGEVVAYTGSLSAAGGSVTDYSGYADGASASAKAKAAGNEAYQKALKDAEEEMARLKDETTGLHKALAGYKMHQSKIRAGADSAVKSLEGAKAGTGGKIDDKKSGGGGGDKDKDEKDKKEWKDEFDRYWEIKKSIDAVDRAMQKLSKDQENLFSWELIKSLDKTNQLLDEQAENYKKLAEMQKAEAAELQGVLGGMGVTFDASGAITNYAAATTAALAQYNEAIAKYNAGLLDEESLKVFEKQYELFKQQLERYETLFYSEMKDTQEKLEDVQRQKNANKLKKWELKLELKLETKQLKREWKAFLREINDDFKSVYKDLSADTKSLKEQAKTYTGKDGTINTDIKAISDVEKDIDRMLAGKKSKLGFESISQAQEKLKELQTQLMDDAKELKGLWQEAWELYLEGIDQVASKYEDIQDKFDHINDQMEYLRKRAKLIAGWINQNGGDAQKQIEQTYQTQIANIEAQTKALKTEEDMWKKLLDENFAKNGYDMLHPQDWDADTKAYYDNWIAAQDKVNSKVEEGLELIEEQWGDSIDQAIKQMDKAVFGMSLDGAKEMWEYAKDASSMYKDNVEKAYELQTLANKVNDDMNGMSLKAQEKLAKYRDEELEYLGKKAKLTQYDLDAANARYQIALAEAQLEDAQNNKTGMKVVRNEEGNWAYQYVADEEDVSDKRQALLDAYNELYELGKKAKEEAEEGFIDAYEKYQSALVNLEELYHQGLIDDEEYAARKDEIYQAFYDKIGYYADTYNEASRDQLVAGTALQLAIFDEEGEAAQYYTQEQLDFLKEINDYGIECYSDLAKFFRDDATADMIKRAKELQDDTNKYLNGIVAYAIERFLQSPESMAVKVGEAYSCIDDANKTYGDHVEKMATAAEQDFKDISSEINQVEIATKDLENATEELADQGYSDIKKLEDAADDLEEAWRSVEDAIKDAIEQLREYLEIRKSAESGGDNSGVSAPPKTSTPDAPGLSKGGDKDKGGSGGGPGGGGTVEDNSKKGPFYISSIGEPHWRGSTDTFAVEIVSTSGKRKEIDLGPNPIRSGITGEPQGAYKRWLENYHQHAGIDWDTGGYTGNWGPSDGTIGSKAGKLAILHQKELVLNAHDTENFLEGMRIIRNLNGSISKALVNGIANMIGSLNGYGINSKIMNGKKEETSNTINEFNITAEFPNANDVNDIREAILSLPNIASQYIAQNRK